MTELDRLESDAEVGRSYTSYLEAEVSRLTRALQAANDEKLLAEDNRSRAEVAKVLAEEEKARAEVAKRLAEEERRRAQVAKLLADEEKDRAEVAKLLAAEEKARAEVARKLAEAEKKQAQEAKALAEEEKKMAEIERKLAEQAKQLADEEKGRADEEKRRVDEERKRADAANSELEAFSYSVAHDLRAPLRGIDGFSQILLEDFGETLDPTATDYLQRIRTGCQRMGHLIDDLLNLSRISRSELRTERVDLSAIVKMLAEEMRATDHTRRVDFKIEDDIVVQGDEGLLAIIMQNLIGNAWKFTSKTLNAVIEFGMTMQNGKKVYFVRDNGAGFDMAFADKLFGVFQRLHSKQEFAGTGIGLATVWRIVSRHGGKIWADGAIGKGATFYLILGTN